MKLSADGIDFHSDSDIYLTAESCCEKGEAVQNLTDKLLSDPAVPTPCLVIDKKKLLANIEKGKRKARELGLTLRPHLKTHKCIDIARMQMTSEEGPAAASTLKEARAYAEAGIRDLIYAVGIAPQKLEEVLEIRRLGCDLKIILDSVPAAAAASAFCRTHECSIPVLIEIDTDGHRSGMLPDSSELVEAAAALKDGACFVGVLTHAGSSYDSQDLEFIKRRAREERSRILEAVRNLSRAGFESEIISVGSSPTFIFSEDESGVTEMRAGVYVMGDLFQSNLGVCRIDEIAPSVLATVIGWQKEKHQVIVDAGWLAMSRDRGTAGQRPDYGYGLVCGLDGRPLKDGTVLVKGANQEHGIIESTGSAPLDLEEFPIGSRVRILPNHACPTLAAHPCYLLVDGIRIEKKLEHVSGWF